MPRGRSLTCDINYVSIYMLAISQFNKPYVFTLKIKSKEDVNFT